MAVLWQSSFEAGSTGYYAESGWTFTGGTTAVTNAVSHKVAGNGGDYSLFVETEAVSPVLAPATPATWLHFWMDTSHPSFTTLWLGFYTWGEISGVILFRSTGSVELCRGLGSSYADTGTRGTFDPTTPHWVAVEFSLTRMTIYVDGFAIAQWSNWVYTGAKPGFYYPTGATGWTQVQFGTASFGGFPAYTYIDDIVITDATTGQLPELVTVPLFPDGDGAPLELTPSTPGTHFSLVNEVPPSTAEYNGCTAINMEDNYDVPSLAWTPTYIPFVSVWSYAVRDGLIGGARHIMTTALATPAARHGVAATGRWAVSSDLWSVDPADSNPWTKIKLDTMQIGLEFVT